MIQSCARCGERLKVSPSQTLRMQGYDLGPSDKVMHWYCLVDYLRAEVERHKVALEVFQEMFTRRIDKETQDLLDAAIEHQETGPCDDVEGWASRLALDVKDADD